MRVLHVSSPDDPRLAAFRAVADPELVRRRGLFVGEGRRVVQALLEDERYVVQRLLVSASALGVLSDAIGLRAGDVEVVVVDGPADLRAVTGHRFHQGCLALAERPAPREPMDLAALRAPGPWAAVGLEGVTNPDNVGTIFRSADAFGAAAVLLSSGCAHPLYRKALRTSMGTVLRLPFAQPASWPSALARLQAEGARLLALTPAADAEDLEAVLAALPSNSRLALLLGSEERGLDAATLDGADHRVRIPMAAGADSLNVAATAAIALQRTFAHARAAP